MSLRIALRFRDRKILLVAAVCALLLAGTVAIMSGGFGRMVSHQADSPVPSEPRLFVPFDQRFPVEIASAPNQVGDVDGRTPMRTAVPATSIDPRTLRRVMDQGVAQFASAADESAKVKGASLVLLSALLGFPPARELVVRNYPRSSAVRKAVPTQDVVRFAVDLLAANTSTGESTAPAPADPAVALGNYFAGRGEVLLFGRYLIDAISDDSRVQAEEQIARLFSVFARAPGVCTGIKRAISQDRTIDQDECSASLGAELLRNVRSRGPTGMENEGRNRGLALLRGWTAATKDTSNNN
jgi:hypothetical protein